MRKIRIVSPYNADKKRELLEQNPNKNTIFAQKFKKLKEHWISWYWKVDDWNAVMLVIDVTQNDPVASSLFEEAINDNSFYKAKLYEWKVYILYLWNSVNKFKELIKDFNI